MSAKVALVTGGAAGIGAAISRRLARDDIAIGVLDLKVEDAAHREAAWPARAGAP